MHTQCKQQNFGFQDLGARSVVAAFDGGTITSDGGALLLRELEDRRRIVRQFADCFTDHRDTGAIEFGLEQLLAQRIFGIALGYEDLNDHDVLRADPLLATVVGASDPSGQRRRRASDRGKALAGKSTLNRVELRTGDVTKDKGYKKIEVHAERVADFFVTVFLQAHREVPRRIYLDLDATDDPIHGQQEGRFFHGYYDCYCYLPLYVFCGRHLLVAKLRRADTDAAAGVVEEVRRLVARIRARWPKTLIVLRADADFARDALMAWCEEEDVEFVLGLAKNERLLAEIAPEQIGRASCRERV